MEKGFYDLAYDVDQDAAELLDLVLDGQQAGRGQAVGGAQLVARVQAGSEHFQQLAPAARQVQRMGHDQQQVRRRWTGRPDAGVGLQRPARSRPLGLGGPALVADHQHDDVGLVGALLLRFVGGGGGGHRRPAPADQAGQ